MPECAKNQKRNSSYGEPQRHEKYGRKIVVGGPYDHPIKSPQQIDYQELWDVVLCVLHFFYYSVFSP